VTVVARRRHMPRLPLLLLAGLAACQTGDGGSGDADGPIALACKWAPFRNEVESFLVYEGEQRIEWVNRSLALPLLEASAGRFVFEADTVAVEMDGEEPFVLRGVRITIDRISGRWHASLSFAPERPLEYPYEPCAVGRAF
jgi:hypothetical protein